MGYSMMACFETKEEKERMQLFLDSHFTPFNKLIQRLQLSGVDAEPYYAHLPSDSLSYDAEHELFKIGFNYGAGISPQERDYFFVICYWMANHSRKRLESPGYGLRPYINYDGCDNWFLFINEDRPTDIESVAVNEHGYRKLSDLTLFERSPKMLQLFGKSYKKDLLAIDQCIFEELERLSKCWEEYTHPSRKE